ncbi:prolyl 4-hydroxylase subunit alpha-1 [Drosophila willistoni]|uniref:prolyl 4-hydroxylase subunit alpha-1 n=1 Tax=Drosophila willistoni TaxID=7260 RepID=UPI000C26D07A|nr:prolyl 4-hydroxylase subunit alpha-1 [Drosophila willistoni]
MLPLRRVLIILIIFKTSLSHLEINYMTLPTHKQKLLEIDLELIGNLERFVNKLQEKIDTLQRLADEIRQPLIEAEGREEEYLGNPLNSFPLLRHLYSDWDLLEEFIANQVGQEQIDFLKEKLSELPLPKDLSAATEAIYRIELAYGVKPFDLAKGLIDGVQYDAKLSSLDCYVMATHHFRLGDYAKASQWLTVALSLMNPSDMKINSVFKYQRTDVGLMLARCFLEMGSEREARYVLSKEVNMTTEEIDVKIKQLQLVGDDSYQHQKYVPDHLLPEGFNAICQSSHKPKPTKHLYCRYNTTTTPFLRLAPFRMEELSLNPYMVAYHNVLSDEEIRQLNRMSAPLLKKAFPVSAVDIDYDVRTVDTAWFPNSETPHTKENDRLIKRIVNIVSDLTGLNADVADSFQAVRYGFGGHYSPHHDYFNESIHQTAVNGDRLATVLFYLNTVKHGGATVFPLLNLKVPAEKGKVLFWYNLDGESLDFDENTEHGVCPVVDGIKLVLASWINEWDQMFIKPNYRPRKQSC